MARRGRGRVDAQRFAWRAGTGQVRCRFSPSIHPSFHQCLEHDHAAFPTEKEKTKRNTKEYLNRERERFTQPPSHTGHRIMLCTEYSVHSSRIG